MSAYEQPFASEILHTYYNGGGISLHGAAPSRRERNSNKHNENLDFLSKTVPYPGSGAQTKRETPCTHGSALHQQLATGTTNILNCCILFIPCLHRHGTRVSALAAPMKNYANSP
ncbi:hypothetical protein AMECASPLE_029107 [Ameca splendens]|uniref:Uncharacterized protein n=1 Tax=Ameca splendens TaxID=208324 RepID=A0ABV0Y5V8_9TELE